jgi:hypothetical protein
MSVTIVTREGRRITAETALEVVSEMNQRALIGEPDAWRYMHALAKRIRAVTGEFVRTGSADEFLSDLEGAGFITIEELPGLSGDAPRGGGTARADDEHALPTDEAEASADAGGDQ